MKPAFLLVLATLAAAWLTAAPASAQTRCPPAGYDRARLSALRAADWLIEDATERRAFALGLPPCLASPDPFLRDSVAFEGLAHMLRARQLDAATQTALVNAVLPRLSSHDRRGFEGPFAALALSELARADRVDPYLDDAQRRRLLDDAIGYFVSVRDYRGFDEREGWRHGVAHGADLLLQLSLNPALAREDLVRIRDAVGAQIAPDGHFYVYGESERLARPIIFMAQRGFLSEAEWTAWFTAVAQGDEGMFSSQAGLARRHNLTAFLQSVWLNARLSESEADDVLLTGAEAALRALP